MEEKYKFQKRIDKSTRRGNAAPRSIHVIPIYLCIEGTRGRSNIMVSRAAWRIAGFVTAAFRS